MHNNATTYFFELLQMSVGRREGLSGTPLKEEWKAMFRMAREQALVGVFTDAVCRLPEEMRPPRKPLTRLCSEVIMIEDTNRHLFRKCSELTEALRADGFDACVLKGQGLALLYPKPVLRQSGDIDVWVKPKRDNDNGAPLEDTIYNYAREKGNATGGCYHHVGASLHIERNASDVVQITASTDKGEEVEFHFRPSFMFSPIHNRRMQHWFDSQWSAMMDNVVGVPSGFIAATVDGLHPLSFSTPTPHFNVVFALTHIFRHLFDEGIGLRQLLDYYYIVMAVNADPDASRREATILTLRRLGLHGFCRAVMYVLHTVFALPKDEMLVPMNERQGRYLLSEIMEAGNFGHYDARNANIDYSSPLRNFIRRQARGLRLLRYFPSEVLWQPYFRVWHRVWRMRRGWIKSLAKD